MSEMALLKKSKKAHPFGKKDKPIMPAKTTSKIK